MNNCLFIPYDLINIVFLYSHISTIYTISKIIKKQPPQSLIINKLDIDENELPKHKIYRTEFLSLMKVWRKLNRECIRHLGVINNSSLLGYQPTANILYSNITSVYQHLNSLIHIKKNYRLYPIDELIDELWWLRGNVDGYITYLTRQLVPYQELIKIVCTESALLINASSSTILRLINLVLDEYIQPILTQLRFHERVVYENLKYLTQLPQLVHYQGYFIQKLLQYDILSQSSLVVSPKLLFVLLRLCRKLLIKNPTNNYSLINIPTDIISGLSNINDTYNSFVCTELLIIELILLSRGIKLDVATSVLELLESDQISYSSHAYLFGYGFVYALIKYSQIRESTLYYYNKYVKYLQSKYLNTNNETHDNFIAHLGIIDNIGRFHTADFINCRTSAQKYYYLPI